MEATAGRRIAGAHGGVVFRCAGNRLAAGVRLPLEDHTAFRKRKPKAESGKVPEMAIGFLRQGARFEIVDVLRCEIATEAINARLGEVGRKCRRGRSAASSSAGPRSCCARPAAW